MHSLKDTYRLLRRPCPTQQPSPAHIGEKYTEPASTTPAVAGAVQKRKDVKETTEEEKKTTKQQQQQKKKKKKKKTKNEAASSPTPPISTTPSSLN
jgi:hypothetical protein